ncbi:MAG: TRAP transporter substrate-binding protein [Desulfobacterales bacterium]|nr:MAG: TRAP transporter substrate-binding protein [Desulfobacterales bacterium]
MTKTIKRVGFLTFVVAIGVALSMTALDSTALAQSKKFEWKMQSTWPAADFHQVNPTGLKEKIETMSGGRLKLELMPAGAVVPAFELLGAVSKGILDAGHAWPGYWTGKHPAATLFSSVAGGPFGMGTEDFLGWVYEGGGLELYNELLQNELKLDVVVFPTFGEAPEPQGWFEKPIKSMDDFKGLKFRAAGMSAEVFKAMGMSVVTLPGGEIAPALERGVIDAAEYSDPSSDMAMGFQDLRKYYHMPGIHQPTGFMEFIINKKKYDELPDDLKAIIKYASMAEALHFTIKMLDRNSQDLAKLVNEYDVTVVQTPRDIMLEVLAGWDKVADEYSKKNAFFAKVLESQKKWAKRVVPYRSIAHPPYDLAADYYWAGENPYKVVKP